MMFGFEKKLNQIKYSANELHHVKRLVEQIHCKKNKNGSKPTQSKSWS